MRDDYPSYRKTFRSGILQKRIDQLAKRIEKCDLCPKKCETNRNIDQNGFCLTGRHPIVSSYFAHRGEEKCLSGWNGSGTIFFSGCNLKCIFCQNHDISHTASGEIVTPEQLAQIMLELQDQGCHNINFVTPSHVVLQILEALPFAIEQGLRLPLVYNTSSYDAVETLKYLDGIIDIYLPDFKFFSAKLANTYLTDQEYPKIAFEAIREMHRQTGDLQVNTSGLATRGVCVRHLLMPGMIEDSGKIFKQLAGISKNMFVNIMNQYHPEHIISDHDFMELNRSIGLDELKLAYKKADDAGLSRFDIDPLSIT